MKKTSTNVRTTNLALELKKPLRTGLMLGLGIVLAQILLTLIGGLLALVTPYLLSLLM